MASAQGEERVRLLAQRAALHYEAGRARPPARTWCRPRSSPPTRAPYLLARAQLEREAGDGGAELDAWQAALAADPALAPRARDRFLALSVVLGARGPARRGAHGAAGRARAAAGRGGPLRGRCSRSRSWRAATATTRRATPPLAEAALQGPEARRAQALLERAGLLQTEGALAEAVRALRALLALVPGHAEAMAALRACLEGLEDWAGLAELLEAQLATATVEGAQCDAAEREALYATLGQLYLERLQRPADAEAALRESLRLRPAALPVRRHLVALALARGAASEAAGLLEEGAQHEALPQTAAQLLREGAGFAREAGDGALALRLCRAAHAHLAAEGEALAELVELLVLEGELAEALPLQQQLAGQVDFAADAAAAERTLLALGQLAERAGEPHAAEAAYRRLLSQRPACEPAALRLAALLLREQPRAAFDVRVALARALRPSPEVGERLAQLAAEARDSLADVGLAAELLNEAAQLAAEPLPVRRALAALYRDAGRTPELMAELTGLASLCLQAGQVALAADAFEERARLAEELGRADEALETLQMLRELLVEHGEASRAAGCERRRAELLRDVKLDLGAAMEALERAFALERRARQRAAGHGARPAPRRSRRQSPAGSSAACRAAARGARAGARPCCSSRGWRWGRSPTPERAEAGAARGAALRARARRGGGAARGSCWRTGRAPRSWRPGTRSVRRARPSPRCAPGACSAQPASTASARGSPRPPPWRCWPPAPPPRTTPRSRPRPRTCCTRWGAPRRRPSSTPCCLSRTPSASRASAATSPSCSRRRTRRGSRR